MLCSSTPRAGNKVLTAVRDPKGAQRLPELKPYTGADTQKWQLSDKRELVSVRWPEVVCPSGCRCGCGYVGAGVGVGGCIVWVGGCEGAGGQRVPP